MDPKGKVIELDIIDDIPYLLRGASSRPMCKNDVNKLVSIISHAKANPAYLTQSRINPTVNGGGGLRTALPVPEVVADVPEEDSDASLVTDDEAEPAPGAFPPPPVPAAGERRPPRDLRADAVSVRHMLTHKPKNKYCDSCNRGKMQNARKFAGAFNTSRAPDATMQLVTCDYVGTQAEERVLAINGDKNAFAIMDLYTGLKTVYSSKERDAMATRLHIATFCDSHHVAKVYADSAPEIVKACEHYGILHEPSVPGVHESSAKIENAILDIERGTRTVLIQAGLPLFLGFCCPALLHDAQY